MTEAEMRQFFTALCQLLEQRIALAIAEWGSSDA